MTYINETQKHQIRLPLEKRFMKQMLKHLTNHHKSQVSSVNDVIVCSCINVFMDPCTYALMYQLGLGTCKGLWPETSKKAPATPNSKRLGDQIGNIKFAT